MKKFLLITALLLFPLMLPAEEQKTLYVKADAITTSKIGGTKQYSRISPDMSAGAGYYLDKSLRLDLVGGNSIFNHDSKYIPCDEIIDNSTAFGTKRINYKAHARYLLVSTYLDVISRDDFKIFINAGVGVTQLKEKVRHLFSGILMDGTIITIPLTVEHFKSKNTRNLLYSFGAGSGIRVHPQVNIDVAYSYKNFGKTKYKAEDKPHIPAARKYKSHNVSIGVRLDL